MPFSLLDLKSILALKLKLTVDSVTEMKETELKVSDVCTPQWANVCITALNGEILRCSWVWYFLPIYYQVLVVNAHVYISGLPYVRLLNVRLHDFSGGLDYKKNKYSFLWHSSIILIDCTISSSWASVWPHFKCFCWITTACTVQYGTVDVQE